MTHALVIGGGIAGPAAALFLRRAGWQVSVFEARSADESFGGLFLNVATNGLAVLEQLGLRASVVAGGHRAPDMVMWSSTGRTLGTVPNGPAGDPARGSVIVTRDHLHRVLRAAVDAAGIPVRGAADLVAVTETAEGVRAKFADGTTAVGDILVGADGIHSRARRDVDPAAVPRYTGLVGLGGVSRVEGMAPTPDTQHFLFGTRAFLGWLVRADGMALWFSNLTAPEPQRGTPEAGSATWLDRLADLHRDDPHPVPQILAATETVVRAYPICDLPSLARWSRGRVVLIGDAAHATSPSSGQGASLALEDAIVLARELRDQHDHHDAFAEYERLRRPRAEAVMRYARAIDRQKRVTSNRLGIAIRDALMPRFLAKARDDTRNDWLYNYVVTWDVPGQASQVSGTSPDRSAR